MAEKKVEAEQEVVKAGRGTVRGGLILKGWISVGLLLLVGLGNSFIMPFQAKMGENLYQTIQAIIGVPVTALIIAIAWFFIKAGKYCKACGNEKVLMVGCVTTGKSKTTGRDDGDTITVETKHEHLLTYQCPLCGAVHQRRKMGAPADKEYNSIDANRDLIAERLGTDVVYQG